MKNDVPLNIDLPALSSMGPAMQALPSDRQRAFVIALLENGDNNHTRAAQDAGFAAGSQNSLRVQAHRLAHDPGIQAAMDEEARRRLNSGKIMAVSSLLTLAKSAAKDSDKLKAIEMVLNRTGLPNQSEHKVTVNDVSKTDEEMIARIELLAGKLGIDATKLLGHDRPAVIDVEFTEVAEHDATGLEDIL